MAENVSTLKLYNLLTIDMEKLKKVESEPNKVQWELVRQNIKYILLFIDKIQLYLNNLINDNKDILVQNKFRTFTQLWHNEELVEEWKEYEVLFRLFDRVSSRTFNDFDDFYRNYFNNLRLYFSGYYENIIKSWSDIYQLGNGELIVEDSSCSDYSYRLLNHIHSIVIESVQNDKNVFDKAKKSLKKLNMKLHTSVKIIVPAVLLGGVAIGYAVLFRSRANRN